LLLISLILNFMIWYKFTLLLHGASLYNLKIKE
jgi:hypothetical protein